jgi:Vault protein inter-alpha-trypsin domain/FlgD Ig-like domain
MKRLLFTSMALVFAFISGNVSGYSYLTVGDPRISWSTDQGTIEDAEIHVRPQGIFMDFDLFLTFSAKGTYYSPSDTLEVVLNFELPQDAIVHDSWLWFGEDTLVARLLDKWTATSVYEGVVKRRRDPSILQQLYGNQYELRIFPMAANQTRKVKISFMLPTRWNKEKVSASLLNELLGISRYPVQNLTVITWADETWKNPVLQGAAGVSFKAENTASLGAHYRADVSAQYLSNRLSISFDSPAKNGVFMSKYENGEEGTYQMALMPSAFVNTESGQKVAVLFDYDISNTNLTIDQVLLQARDLLLQNLSPHDSFNLLFSNISITKASNNWLPADSATITNTFKGLRRPLSSYSNLPTLINAGIEFIKTRGNKGKIILISNSSDYGSSQVANKLLNDIMALMDPILPFYIVDYCNAWNDYYWINQRTYYNNEYLFTNLSKFTKGSYERILDGKSYSEILDNALRYLGGSIKSFDLYTKLSNGICYGRYLLGTETDIVYINNPVLQVGKFKGEFPFEIDYSGEYNSEIISDKIILDEANVHTSDSLLEAIWAGIYIQHLEQQNQTNEVISEIIQNSLGERVLSLYTAFLCIEEAFLPCEDCEDQNVTAIPDFKISMKDVLSAYPNPFSASVTITVSLGEGSTEKVLQAGIYNITGERIFVPGPEALQSQQEFEFQWDGLDKDGNPLPAGVYIFILQTDKNVYQVKLIKQ